MRSLSILLLLFILLLATSCSNRLHYFTETLQTDFEWNDEELKRIQFYLSDDIVLQRRLRDEDTRITNGKIRLVDGSEIEEIKFERGTPGIVLFIPKTHRFAVSFEQDDDRYLMFGPNPKAGGRFVLLAKDWDRRIGSVSYNGKTYKTSSESAFAALMVDIKKARDINYKSRRAGGRTVQN